MFFPLVLPWKREKLWEIWNWEALLFLKYSGLWIEEFSSKSIRQYLYYWRIITVSVGLSFFFSLIIETVSHSLSLDMADRLKSWYILSPFSIATVKSIFLLKHRKSLKRAMDFLDEMTRMTSYPGDLVIVREYLTKIWIIFLILCFSITWAVSHWWRNPFIHTKIFGNNLGSTIFEAIGLLFIIVGVSSFYTIYFVINEYIICHLSVFDNNLRRLHLKMDPVVLTDLKKIVNYHDKLLQVCKDVGSSFEVCLVTEIMMTVFTNCLAIIIIYSGIFTNFHDILHISEVGLILNITAIFICWYSNEISIQCDNFGTSAYVSDWIKGSERQKKTLYTLMIRTMKPVKFGGFFEIKLETTINIMKATFSYYNMIQALSIIKE